MALGLDWLPPSQPPRPGGRSCAESEKEAGWYRVLLKRLWVSSDEPQGL